MNRRPLFPSFDEKTALPGFIDRQGKVVVKPQYRYVAPFSEGLAAVETPDSCCVFIDEDGVVLFTTPGRFAPDTQFRDGRVLLSGDFGEGMNAAFLRHAGQCHPCVPR